MHHRLSIRQGPRYDGGVAGALDRAFVCMTLADEIEALEGLALGNAIAVLGQLDTLLLKVL